MGKLYLLVPSSAIISYPRSQTGESRIVFALRKLKKELQGQQQTNHTALLLLIDVTDRLTDLRTPVSYIDAALQL